MVVNILVYETQATNLWLLMIASPDELLESMSDAPPYVIVRVLDQKLLETVKGDKFQAAYEMVVEPDQPFGALLLENVARRIYFRVASSYAIIPRIDNSGSSASSEITTLNIV